MIFGNKKKREYKDDPTKELVEKAKSRLEEIRTVNKFDHEKLRQAAVYLIRVYRDAKIIPSENKYSKLILETVDMIDPDHKLSERDLVDKLIENQDVKKALNEALCNENLISDEEIKKYIDKYYEVLRGVLLSPEPRLFDQYEYQSQQLISVLSVQKVNLFKEYLQEKMDADPTCPYFLKKVFTSIMASPSLHIPTEDNEKTAEDIMGLVCPGLQKDRPEVFRALVDSLKWRGTEDLQRTLANVKKTPPEKRHIRGRESCIFIEAEDSVHYVG